MARQGISKEQVFEVATALQEEGTAPTVQSVRDRIGSGSYSTINTHLAAWRKEHVGQAPANIPDMPEKVRNAFNQVWAAAAKAAQDDVETQRQALEAMRREMDKEKADMTVEIARLEKEVEEATTKLETAGRDLEAQRKGRAAAEKQVTDLRIENARLDERTKAAEGVADELREQLKTLHERFAEVAGQKKQTQRGTKAPKPKEP
jgi:chromosome segregation ATPase